MTIEAPPIPKLIDALEMPEPYRGGRDGLPVERLMSNYGVPAMSVAVIEDFEPADTYTHGLGDRGYKTMMQAASISKPLAAAAVLIHDEQGKIDIDKPANDQLEEWKIPGDDADMITPRMFMGHIAGLGDAYGCPGYKPNGEVPTTVQTLNGELPACTAKVRVARKPGTEYHYSNLGYVVLQQLLTEVTQMPFVDVMRQVVLDPVQMENSTFGQPEPEDATLGHDREGKHHFGSWRVFPEKAAAGLWTTPFDLCKFASHIQRILKGEKGIMSVESARQMITPCGIGDFTCGFRIVKDGQGWYASHRGTNPGYQSTLRFHILKGYGMAVMCNGDNGEVVNHEILTRVQREYNWDSTWQTVDGVPVRGFAPLTEVAPS